MPCSLGLTYSTYADAVPANVLVSITTTGEGDKRPTKKEHISQQVGGHMGTEPVNAHAGNVKQVYKQALFVQTNALCMQPRSCFCRFYALSLHLPTHPPACVVSHPPLRRVQRRGQVAQTPLVASSEGYYCYK